MLGDREANERLERVLEMMHRDEVTYISVKLSAIVSQITTIDHEGSLARVVNQLRALYRAAQRDGVFVNLDMEEYRDLRLTVDGFRPSLSVSRRASFFRRTCLIPTKPSMSFWPGRRFASSPAPAR